MLMFGFRGPDLDAQSREMLMHPLCAGVIWFKRNVEDTEQIRRVNANLHATRPGLLTAIDQEGGPVRRILHGVTEVPAMRRVDTEEDAHRWGRTLGRELRALGIDMNFAPVLDVDSNPDNPIIGERAFSNDPEVVAALGIALHEGLVAEGVASCGKHFPGHGDTNLDSHLDLPRLDHDVDRLRAVEWLPFRRAIEAGIPAIMTAHVVFEALDTRPGTLSRPVVTGLLRDELGFDGVVVSDDLEMKAVADRWSVEDLTEQAIEAGVDLLLMCHDPDKQARVLDTLERLDTSAARARIAHLADRFGGSSDAP